MRDKTIIDRVTFLDGLGDCEFFCEMSSLDAVIVNYLETAMSASSVLSQALELGVPVITSRCTTFEMAQDHFGKTFEMFDPGNSVQLRQKILAATSNSQRNRTPCSLSLESLCQGVTL